MTVLLSVTMKINTIYLDNMSIYLNPSLLTSVILMILLSLSRSDAQQFDEHQIKTVFIYNLTKMVEWPQDYLATAPFSICFLGEDVFGEVLDSLKGKTVNDRALVLKKNISLKQAQECHILFISASEARNITHILSSLESIPVLTVSDTETFAKQGGIISFLIDRDNHTRIEINLKVAVRKGLKISSKLLSLDKVRIVEEP